MSQSQVTEKKWNPKKGSKKVSLHQSGATLTVRLESPQKGIFTQKGVHLHQTGDITLKV